MVIDDLKRELDDMRMAYHRHPIRFKYLPRPSWVTKNDGLSRVFAEKNTVYTYGEVYYGCIIQANNNLYRKDNRLNCPANILYTTDEGYECELDLLRETVQTLHSYRDRSENEIPANMRELISVLTSERDRSQFVFTADKDEKKVRVIYSCTMIFRADLPNGLLKNRYIPILAAPKHCTSILTLPKKYWTDGFMEFWNTSD